MPLKPNEPLLEELISGKLKKPVAVREISSVAGGSINDAFRLKTQDGHRFFIKINTVTAFPSLLEKERNGLEFLAKQKIIGVPEIIAYHKNGNQQLLVLEWIEEGVKTQSFWETFGEQLAQLHKTDNHHFGFHEDNYMGSLSQSNIFSETWTDFFIHRRLLPQVQLATGKGLLSSKHAASFERLYKKTGEIFNEEVPSLLHGDLWRGNFLCGASGLPVVIDPAIYFGHRNMDMAMTTLFGGFDKLFYESYHYHFPLADNYRDQWSICNLYPLLIHLNLFGSGYLPEINSILKKFTG